MAYFDVDKINEPKNEYVCWIDIMGTKEAMKTDIRRCANFIFKLHASVIEACANHKHITPYPVMDGVFITSSSKQCIFDCISSIFSNCASDFCREKDVKYLYLIKGALAYGAVYHGRDLPSACNNIFDSQSQYKQSLLLGMPVIQAFLGEKSAPPFGIYIDESARAFAPDGEKPIQWKWHRWDFWTKFPLNTMIDKMTVYFQYVHNHAISLNYPQEDVKRHISTFNDYFDANISLEREIK